jgi:hypothetical protein
LQPDEIMWSAIVATGSTPAPSNVDVSVIVLAITAVVFSIVWTLLIYAVARMRVQARGTARRSQLDVPAAADMNEAIGRKPS